MARNVAPDRLGVDNEEPDFSGGQTSEIDHSDATALSHAWPRPANLSATAAAGYDITRLRIAGDPNAKGFSLFLCPQLFRVLNEGGRFGDCVHEADYTSRTYFSQASGVAAFREA